MIQQFVDWLKKTMEEKETDFGAKPISDFEVNGMKNHHYSDTSYLLETTIVTNPDHIDALVSIITDSLSRIGDRYEYKSNVDLYHSKYSYVWTENNVVIPTGQKYDRVIFKVSLGYGRLDKGRVTVSFTRPDITEKWKDDFSNLGKLKFEFEPGDEIFSKIENLFSLKKENGYEFRRKTAFGGSILEEISRG